ncbi:hypothetical protein [Arundinibacter roseus]|uniref:Uncharacterized protein n=1 Tax=Arundinibacter roseus TaxID=2070510 RepID=A0A4R4K7W7_9BACT|nr:hypothetical protein [Arundinibacter roseus]TDB63708.1 hypothetical protein EZE20_15535 [Arundinibacter roseus]
MKKHLLRVSFLFVGVGLLASCDREKDVEPVDTAEHKYMRVLVSDEQSTQLTLVNPRTETIETFQAAYPKSALYSTASGRFGSVIHRAQNMVQKFDTGFENHGDHVDVKGTPKWAAIVSEGKLPTHFKSRGNEVMLFNDGDGTLSVANETEFHSSGVKFKTIDAGNVAHHGAMAKFDNGTYAITEKDGSVAGTLPERVKIIDATGKVVHASTVQTKGIHGNAGNGSVSLFGSSSGILVVEASGAQRLIPHPADFGTAWFGTILEAKAANSFIGYTAAKGAYLINVTSGQITPIIESTDIMQCKVNYGGTHLLTLLHSGELRVYDLSSNSLVKSGSILPATAKDETQKPQLEATERYAYITQPKTGELLTVATNDFSKTSRIKVSATPYRLSLVGMESSEDH